MRASRLAPPRHAPTTVSVLGVRGTRSCVCWLCKGPCPHIGSQPPNHPESQAVIPVRRSYATAFVLNSHEFIDTQHARQKIICSRRQPASLLVHFISLSAFLPALQPSKTKDCKSRVQPPAASLHFDQSCRCKINLVTPLLSPHRESLTVHPFKCSIPPS